VSRSPLVRAALALLLATPVFAPEFAACAQTGFAVGAQYDSTHVYVSPADFDRFIASFILTFGGTAGKQTVTTVTPTSSRTIAQAIVSPVGLVSVFGFQTPIPYPFGSERTGYLVNDLDAAVTAARTAGAAVVVAPFPDPIGRDAVIQWPGGVSMQLYWHTTPPQYPALASVPENRVYVAAEKADEFVRDFIAFSRGRILSDDPEAPGADIGTPTTTFRRIRIDSVFGRLAVLVTDGHLPYPFGRETTGYEVGDLTGTLARATASGATVVVPPYSSDAGRRAAMVAFPGGYIAEIHQNLAAR
jgi:predicted enzyme related to lactoylglutathione lyase